MFHTNPSFLCLYCLYILKSCLGEFLTLFWFCISRAYGGQGRISVAKRCCAPPSSSAANVRSPRTKLIPAVQTMTWTLCSLRRSSQRRASSSLCGPQTARPRRRGRQMKPLRKRSIGTAQRNSLTRPTGKSLSLAAWYHSPLPPCLQNTFPPPFKPAPPMPHPPIPQTSATACPWLTSPLCQTHLPTTTTRCLTSVRWTAPALRHQFPEWGKARQCLRVQRQAPAGWEQRFVPSLPITPPPPPWRSWLELSSAPSVLKCSLWRKAGVEMMQTTREVSSSAREGRWRRTVRATRLCLLSQKLIHENCKKLPDPSPHTDSSSVIRCPERKLLNRKPTASLHWTELWVIKIPAGCRVCWGRSEAAPQAASAPRLVVN